ncbi:MAG: cell wall metabolism sensor histidine kinase WalK [Oscillospiraceae bacterium]|nr:cell wall metabolism sensor histidine kinase WalK [Oscillospiraceae bacterium]
MNRSLYSKLVLVIILLIVSLMTVVGAFLMRGIQVFYLNEFYKQMQSVFSNVELVNSLRSAADDDNPELIMTDILRAYSGQLGIDSGSRNYYILSGSAGSFITGSDPEGGASLQITANILSAVTGKEGYSGAVNEDHMDVALPVSGEKGSFIIYIKDNKETIRQLSRELFKIITDSLAVGLTISVLLSLLLAKTMVTPLQSLKKAVERVAAGDFSDKPDIHSADEIGVLSNSFNNMADRLERILDDLTKSETMRREFVANVSHELRTPLTNIRSYAETLETSPMPRETESKFLSVIVSESDRMTKIVQDLLTLSRFDAGSDELICEEFSFEKSVRDVFSAMQLEARRRNQEFTLEFKGSVPEITGDKARIEQVLMNMVSNAMKYTPEGGSIRINVKKTGGAVQAQVRDNGVGIPKEDIDKVFDRFYRVDKARSRESGGTGLGLSIAKEIVGRHNGKIDIQSRLGHGTTITVTLPVSGPGHYHEEQRNGS